MANALFDKARQRFLLGSIIWGDTSLSIPGDAIKAILVDTGVYTPNLASHEFLSDVGSGSRISTSGPFTAKAAIGGAADAADVTFLGVGAGGSPSASIEAIILYKDTTVEATSPLIAYIDTATGLPITPNGGDIIVTWDNGPNKIFKL